LINRTGVVVVVVDDVDVIVVVDVFADVVVVEVDGDVPEVVDVDDVKEDGLGVEVVSVGADCTVLLVVELGKNVLKISKGEVRPEVAPGVSANVVVASLNVVVAAGLSEFEAAVSFGEVSADKIFIFHKVSAENIF
jgi:hypothetical protein